VVDRVIPFEAPVRVLVARVHEAAVIRGPDGDPRAEVTVRVSECAGTALRDRLGLPTAPPLAEVDPLVAVPVARRTAVSPGFDADEAAFEGDAERLRAARPGEAPALARFVVALPIARLLVLRPCRLVSVSSGRSRAAVLVDGAARQATALLSTAAFEALGGEIAERPLPSAPAPALRPMRCPECATPFPIDREGQLRLCPACRRAWLVSGRRLQPVAYRAELPDSPRGRLLVPAWRVGFTLEDPRDGSRLSSLREVRARCGEETGDEPGAAGGLDVPAFLPYDRLRETRGLQPLAALPPAAFPLFEGPVRGEAGFPPVRSPGALGPLDAAAFVRGALLAALRPETVARATPRRLKALLFGAPLEVGTPRLVLRALPRPDVQPV
jgi:hypothetical protein